MDLGKSLVITHPARMGDSLMALPLQRAIASVTELETNVGEPYHFFFDLAGIRYRHAGPLYPKGLSALIREGKQLKARGYGSVFLVRPNFRSALLARLAGIPIRVGDATEGRGALLTHRATPEAKANQLERLQAFGAAVGLEVTHDFGLPRASRAEPPLVGIMPGASYSDKVIPAPVLREVAEGLIDQGYRLVFVGGPNDAQWEAPLADVPGERWIGTYSLPELIAPLTSLTAAVAADGGLYHLAVACGVPSVGVYGPTANRHWYHAWGPHVPVLAPGGLMGNVTSEMVRGALAGVLGRS